MVAEILKEFSQAVREQTKVLAAILEVLREKHIN